MSQHFKRWLIVSIGLSFAPLFGSTANGADVAAGERSAVGCNGCHNAANNDLAGRDAKWLLDRMLVIRDGEMPAHPPVFGLLKPADLEDVAAYYSGLNR